jgi:circadian clock protein KaiC
MPLGIEFKMAKKLKGQTIFEPTFVPNFDRLIQKGGIERGSSMLVAGGAGTGKSTFVLQSLYQALQKGEKAVYISFEQSTEKVRRHCLENFGWDFAKFEKKKKFVFLDLDPFVTARNVEASLAEKKGELLISVKGLDIPFTPDRIAVDSLSALAVAFLGNIESYRYYIRHLFLGLEMNNSVNYFVAETAPLETGRGGTEEFLADCVVVFYNPLAGSKRNRFLEVLKMRASKHAMRMVPFDISSTGITVHAQGPGFSSKKKSRSKTRKKRSRR